MQMHDMCADRKTDECSYVQPVSLKLFGDISHIALSDHAENLKIECKKSNHIDTKYSTTLHHPSGKIIKISGETDSTLLYCGVPISTWKDKSLNKTAETVQEIAQPLAEVKGMVEKFKEHVGRDAPKFFGVLTTGLIWTMPIRGFSEGNVVFAKTNAIYAWNEETDTIDDEGLNIITSILLSSLRSAEVLIKM